MAECPKGEYVVKKEVFGGEELEAIYRMARKPVANQEEIDLATSDDPMARMGQGFCPAFNQRVYEAAPRHPVRAGRSREDAGRRDHLLRYLPSQG